MGSRTPKYSLCPLTTLALANCLHGYNGAGLGHMSTVQVRTSHAQTQWPSTSILHCLTDTSFNLGNKKCAPLGAISLRAS